ncbi:MAG: GNAT family N-acetyltransferase [Chromatiaceae bacterium]|nr:GNAT family N-acetyltransferase [Chromatiaceae bacterium]
MDMTTLNSLLWRNQGQTLTPELIVGIQASFDECLVTGEPPVPIPGNWIAAPNLRPSRKTLVLDQHERVAQWVAERAGASVHAWAGYVCLGLEEEGELVAGVVMESFTGRSANMHVAGVGRNWVNRNMLQTCFIYAFDHLGLQRLTGLVPASNTAALAFDLHLGFRHEYTLVDGAKDGDLHILCMRRADCRFLPQEE